MDEFALNHPVLFALALTIAWFVLLFVVMGIASSLLHKPYGDMLPVIISRVVIILGTLLLIWQLGWMQKAGVVVAGSWQVWLLALGGLIYITCASLYAFYGKVAFDLANLARNPAAPTIILTHALAAICEEVFFRGLVLYILSRVWGHTPTGIIASIALTALFFSVLHIIQVFTGNISVQSALYLALQTLLISFWWGALVMLGASIWPAVVLHFVVNAIIAVQALTTPVIKPDILAYQRLLWFSIPLGLLGIGLILPGGSERLLTRFPRGKG